MPEAPALVEPAARGEDPGQQSDVEQVVTGRAGWRPFTKGLEQKTPMWWLQGAIPAEVASGQRALGNDLHPCQGFAAGVWLEEARDATRFVYEGQTPPPTHPELAEA